MITLKKFDVYGQVVLIILSLIYIIVKIDSSFIYCYFFVGGWQVMSTLLQLLYGRSQPVVSERRSYHIFLVVSLVTLPVYSFILLLFVAPFTAVWYLYISYQELKIWQARNFIQFK